MLQFVEAIAKWSMADVFVVALFIACLAAQPTRRRPAILMSRRAFSPSPRGK
jgi:uncharacterized paraquat-inducible protein A